MITTRRSFCGQLLSASATLGVNLKLFALATSVANVIAGMVDNARNHLHETNWAPRRAFGPIPKAYYCNIFVADVARESGGATWDPISRPSPLLPDRDPVAREWEDPTFVIKGWTVIFHAGGSFGNVTAEGKLKERQPGDIISGGGHVGIVSQVGGTFRGQTISAAADTDSQPGSVVENDWSFRLPDSSKFHSALEWENAAKNNVRKYTVRRFAGV